MKYIAEREGTEVFTTEGIMVGKIYAYYSDAFAAYALIQEVHGKIWRIRSMVNKDTLVNWPTNEEADYPGDKFKDIGAFVGYCKFKHPKLCTGVK